MGPQDEYKRELIKRIEALRDEQLALHHERMRWSQVDTKNSPEGRAEDDIMTDRKECGALEASISNLRIEKQHLIVDIQRVSNELDEVGKARAEMRWRRKEHTMHSMNKVMAFKSSAVRLRRNIFSIMKEEGVSDAIIQSIYTAIAKIETESPTASSVRRQRRRVKERTDKEAKKVNILL